MLKAGPELTWALFSSSRLPAALRQRGLVGSAGAAEGGIETASVTPHGQARLSSVALKISSQRWIAGRYAVAKL